MVFYIKSSNYMFTIYFDNKGQIGRGNALVSFGWKVWNGWKVGNGWKVWNGGIVGMGGQIGGRYA